MKKSLVLTFLLVTIILSGCWDSMELNDIAIVTGIAIDPGKEEKIRMSIGYVNPGPLSQQPPEQGAPISLMTLEGISLPEISARMNQGVSRKLIFSHTRVIYVNEKVAEKGMSSLLDSLDRSPQFRNDFNILITKGHDAKEFIKVNDPLEKIPALKTQKQIRTLVEGWGGGPRVRLTDFINAVVSKGRSPVSGMVKIQGDPDKGKSVDSNMSIEPAANIILDGFAVYRDDKLIGFLTLGDARIYSMTQGLDKTIINIPCDPETEEKERPHYDVVITNSKSRMETNYEHGIPRLKVNIYGEARVNNMECIRDLSKTSTFKEFEKASSKYIANMVKESIEKVQKEFKVDIYGFGEALERQHYQKAKEVLDNWDDEFSRGEVDVTVRVSLRRAGIRSKSFLSEIPDEE